VLPVTVDSAPPERAPGASSKSVTRAGHRRRRARAFLVHRAWTYLSTERRKLVGLAALSVFAAQAESVALVLIALIADSAARGAANVQFEMGPVNIDLMMTTAGVLTGAAIIVAALLTLTNGYFSARVSARLERDSRDEIVTTFAMADWEYQSTQKSSRVQGRVLRLMHARSDAFSGMVRWSRAFATVTVFVIVAATMSPWTAVVILMFGAVLSFAVFPIRRRIARLGSLAAEQEVGLATDIAEAADHGSDVQVFGAWPAFLDRFGVRSHFLQRIRASLSMVKSLSAVVYQYGALALILITMLVASSSAKGSGIGQFAAAALLLLRSVQYGQQLQSSLQQIAEAVPRIELLIRELRVPPPRFTPGSRSLEGIECLEVRDLSYRYPDSATCALKGVSLDLRPGTIIGLAGPSGSGKSTLAQILLRLRWPTSGRYLVNGLPAEEYSSASWNRLVSHVPQQPHLLHGTLAENVSFLDDSISREMIAKSLDSVGLTDLLESLPEGLNTPLGPTGRNLSGGQVQRLGITRALARGPRLVILDEPTSALDVNAERLVREALEALRGRADLLVVVIAHRPTTLAVCDNVVVLQDGEVVATGLSGVVARQNNFLAMTWGDVKTS
jgi:ATP-binding cassette, subfamily B, bacterial